MDLPRPDTTTAPALANEIAEARAAMQRFAFLADASAVLAADLDYARTLQEVARLAVPTLADICVVDIVEEDRTIRRVATAHVRPERTELLERLREFVPEWTSPHPAARVLRSGRPERVPVVAAEVVSTHTESSEHAAVLRQLNVRGYMCVPLVARGTTLGVLTLGVTESDRRYDEADLRLAQELAGRAALAIDNARLYHAAQAELAQRERAEEAHRLSEARFRAVMEQFPLSIQIFEPDGTLAETNAAWERLWGVPAREMFAYNVLADPQLDALGITPLLRRAFAGEAVELPTVRYDPDLTAPGYTHHADPARWVRAFAYPITGPSGEVRQVVLVHEDTTARVLAEQRQRASEERLRVAMTAARMNVWHWDLTTGRVECTDNAREVWGREIGHADDFRAAIHPDDRALVAEAARIAREQKVAFQAEYRIVLPDAPVRWVQSRGQVEYAPDGTPVRIMGATLDITSLKAAEAATRLLADAGERLGTSLDERTTLAALARLVVPRLADGCIVDLLDDAGALQRVALEDVDRERARLAAEVLDRFPPAPEAHVDPWHVVRTGEPTWVAEVTDAELRRMARSEEHLRLLRALDVRSYISVPLLARGMTIGVLTLTFAGSGRRYRASDLALAQDLARRAAAAVDNARLYARVRLEDRRKDEFLATLAHELRNPLAPIRTGLEVLRLGPTAETAARTREMMERQLAHMVHLIDDLLDLSRVTRGTVQLQRARIDLRSVVSLAIEASSPLLSAAGHELVVRLPETALVVDADRTRLAQVLSNLLHNAVKYTDRGGRIELVAVPAGQEVDVRIRDSGVGIPSDMLHHVFEMFTQVGRSQDRSQGGLGIGLTLVRRLVELHGGRVWAESAGPGTGSTFVVRLPLAEVVQSAPPDTSPGERVSSPPVARRVLVVDDNVDAAEYLALLLEMKGHEVRTAESGPEALAVLRTFDPEIAILDIGLPGMSGYELARAIRGTPGRETMLLIAVTGWGAEDDRREARAAGFDHHMTKPVDPSALEALVRQAPVAADGR